MTRESDIAIVFVYLNSTPPKYLTENIRRLNHFFPDVEVFYVSDQEFFLPKDLIAKNIMVDLSKYNHALSNHGLSSKFRSGFWQTSLLRLLILSDVHDLIGERNLLHIEADVVLMKEFPIRKFSDCETLLWTGFNETLDVAALLYSPSQSTTNELSKSILSYLENDPLLTDMKALSKFRREFPSKARLLPSRVSDIGYSDFGCIFDGANYGMWLLGQDQRNHFGLLSRYQDLKECSYEVGNSSFTYSNGRLLLGVSRDSGVKLVNLHVHCKDPRIFQIDDAFLRKRVGQSNSRYAFPVFSPKIFLDLLISAITNGEFRGFIYHLPIIGSLVKMLRRFYSRFSL